MRGTLDRLLKLLLERFLAHNLDNNAVLRGQDDGQFRKMGIVDRFKAEIRSLKLKRENKKLNEFGLCLEAEIGHGNYSTVFRGLFNSKAVAVKIVDERKTPPGYIVSFLPREIKLSRKVEHQNLLRIDKIFNIAKRTFIISELGRFDLLQYLRLKGALRESLSRRLFYDLCNGLHALHSHGIVHRLKDATFNVFIHN